MESRMAFALVLPFASGRRRTFLLLRNWRRPDVLCRHGRWLLRLSFGLARTTLFQRLACDQHLDFRRIQRFPLQKGLRNPDESFAVSGQQTLGALIAADHEPSYFLIDGDSCALAIVAMLSNFAAQKDLLLLLSECQRTKG